MIGTKLAHYEITSHLGSGGMGDVYQATDSKLGRSVAIKLLPEAFSHDTDRAARFDREARVLASLNHPNIAAIYGIEEANQRKFLVMELVPGETLAERIKRGPVPIDEALNIANRICEALEAAHDKGIIHRDLKPANIKLTPDSSVKVLDFGLAKAMEGGPTKVGLSNSPTLTIATTQQGMILGTAAYMSPEQARGREVDRRTDIFSFGCVLYEMLTGRAAFEGEDVTEILSRVLQREPDWTLLLSNLPPSIPRLLRLCLQKDVKKRRQTAADVRIDIEEALEEPVAAAMPAAVAVAPVSRTRERVWIAIALAAILLSAAVWTLKPAVRSANSAIARLSVALQPGDRVGDLENPALAMSADGTVLAYVGIRDDTQQLYLRSLDSLESKPIPGTEGASNPFFSPNGQWIGFFAQGKLRKVSVTGSATQTLCEAANGRGGSWGTDDTIYFAPTPISAIWKVSDSGGTPQQVTTLDRSKGEISHRWPQVLPGGKTVLFSARTGPGWDEMNIEAQSLQTGERRVLMKGGETGRYVSAGYLVYTRTDALMAAPMDLARLEVTSGAPVVLAETVRTGGEGAQYAMSDSGVLAYVAGDTRRFERRLVWVDRKGDVEPLSAPTRNYGRPQTSPDGHHAAVEISGGTIGIWIYDFSRTTLTPLTSAGSSQASTWTPDGNHVAYRGTRTGFRNLFWKAADGTGDEERLATSENTQTPGSWSPDGKWLAYHEASSTTGNDIWVLPVNGDRKPQVFLRTPFQEGNPRFSPDGRWVAYESTESGRNEVYARPFPGSGAKSQISTQGGTEPVWSRNGRELFYLNGDKMMAVDTATQPTFTAEPPGFFLKGGTF
jgi:eukaryotic-like serine/threonine-protein kinase